jgi:hypothetical protein
MTVVGALHVVSCSSDSSPTGPEQLPDVPQLVSPSNGETTSNEFPLFTIVNARGYDEGQAEYTFRVSVASTGHEVGSLTARAGRGQTAVRFPDALLAGATLSWQVTGRRTNGDEVSSTSATFRVPSGTCPTARDPFAKSVTDWWISACSMAANLYNDPNAVLGPPDAQRTGPGTFSGMVSLGSGGWVAVDMEACAVDGPGDDVRVYQTVSSEPVTLYASSEPRGPWVLVESRKPCDGRAPGYFSRACSFDLARAGLEQARYFKIEDGELYPCPGGSGTDGADIDAIEILNMKP